MKIAVLCTLSLPLNALEVAIKDGLKIHKLIGLHPASISSDNNVSGYIDIKGFALHHKIKYEYVSDYSLKAEAASSMLKGFDLLWVAGWQRIIPRTFLETPRFGAIGSHGSCDGITLGRGRSPHNWALLIGANQFITSIFRLSEGIDDGQVMYTTTVPITQQDNITSLYLKTTYATGKALSKIIKDNLRLNGGTDQNFAAAYFPKRIATDGEIDWWMSSINIYNQIRALQSPYPLARTYYQKKILFAEQALPIELDGKFIPGQIIAHHVDGSTIIGTGDGCILVKFSANTGEPLELQNGGCFTSIPMQKTVSSIFKRFNKEYPGKTLNPSLLKFWDQTGYKVS